MLQLTAGYTDLISIRKLKKYILSLSTDNEGALPVLRFFKVAERLSGFKNRISLSVLSFYFLFIDFLVF